MTLTFNAALPELLTRIHTVSHPEASSPFFGELGDSPSRGRNRPTERTLGNEKNVGQLNE
ncbi:unnamed protein product [Prunus armeniaca]|uniref:Uncharacterized protein n=1 Tax=Prunus armeniaca TaxID=36596 RepID=A0A6J5WTY0_PRUAR|nr:hypothetical protein GBA52_010620 [Prunus armeniaca]CAB4273366.1 unnamed protein product [Prunus armeniaca]CAB4303841.1 unnamed protein product [Prunus armeniaca]